MTLLVQDGMNLLVEYIYYSDNKDNDNRQSTTSTATSKLDRKANHWVTKIAIVFVLIAVVITIGVIFLIDEGDQTFVDSIYWSVVSITSVGYGDISLEDDNERIFVILFVVAALFLVSAGVAIILEIIEEERFRQEEIKLMAMELDIDRLAELDKTGEGVDKSTFVLAILQQLGVIDEKKHVHPWLQKFDEYDKDGSGRLDEEDLRLMNEQENTIRRNSLIDLTEDTAKRFFEEGVTKLFHAEHDKHIMEQARGSMDRQSHPKITAGSISGEVHISKEAMAENKGVNDEINPMH